MASPLAQYLPVLLLTLIAGHLTDRFDRRRVLALAALIMALGSVGLAAQTHTGAPLWRYYAFLSMVALGQAFANPGRIALLGDLAAGPGLARAVAVNTTATQIAYLCGPPPAGGLIAWKGGALAVYAMDAICGIVFALALLMLPKRMGTRADSPRGGLLEGIRFVLGSELILAAYTLDLFSVLVGGAVALLPIFAKDILGVGPVGLGLLMAATPLGSFVGGAVLSRIGPLRRTGPVLLSAVAGFGLATIAFGGSSIPVLSWALLFLIGAFDVVNVVVRVTLLQHLAPDAIRGRVAAVLTTFNFTSNKLGALESGLVAAWLGPIPAVVIGGIGTLLTVALVAARWPALARLRRIAS